MALSEEAIALQLQESVLWEAIRESITYGVCTEDCWRIVKELERAGYMICPKPQTPPHATQGSAEDQTG